MKKVMAVVVSLVVMALSFTNTGSVTNPSKETYRIEDVELVLEAFGKWNRLQATLAGTETCLD